MSPQDAVNFSSTTTDIGRVRIRTQKLHRLRADLPRGSRRGSRQRRQGCLLEREPAGVDYRAVGLSAERIDRGPDRLPRVARVSRQGRPHRRSQAVTARRRRGGYSGKRGAKAESKSGEQRARSGNCRISIFARSMLPPSRLLRSRATIRSKSSSRPVRQQSRKAWC